MLPEIRKLVTTPDIDFTNISHVIDTTRHYSLGGTFRSKITSYGDFRNRAVWADNKCRGKCPVIYSGQYRTTAGFRQHNCSDNLQNSSFVGFWCDWGFGDGAVMMIGGGGSSCGRADHGIGITEENRAKFGAQLGYNFGDGAESFRPTTYALNLWVR